MRTSASSPCDIVTLKKKQSLSSSLSGIPAGAAITAAYLYWAGSGQNAPSTVQFDGKNVGPLRQYSGSYTDAGTTYYYFSGVADVTTTVQGKGNSGNGSYTFAGLTVDNGDPYCRIQGVVGGFALLVIYADPSQPFRVLNLYEGFQFTRDSNFKVDLSNFRVPSPLGSNTGRIAHITWEGDEALTGDNLSFNTTALTDNLNPVNNQFNSKSNIDGNSASYGIDFDAYTLGDPIIKAGDTTASTTYVTGQDLVWLSAEIVAVPNVPTADLAITMTHSGVPSAGSTVIYTVNVTNNGPDQESGPITVTDTLPFGMGFASSSGTNWSCSSSGQVVTCSHPGPLDTGKALDTLTLNASVSAGSTTTTYTNVATVAGQLFDNVAANSTVSDTATDTSQAATAYAITDAPCSDGIPIANAGQPGCHRYTGPFLAGGAAQPLYITNLDSNGVPAYRHRTQNRTVNMNLSLTCINPGTPAGVQAVLYDQSTPHALPLCGAGSMAQTVLFPGGQPSGRWNSGSGSAYLFSYADVGVIQFNAMAAGTSTVLASARFVSVPTRVVAAYTNADGGANPGNTAGNTYGFARAGETFNLLVKAVMADGATPPPNFGREALPYGPVGVALGANAGAAKFPAPVVARQSAGVFSGTAVYKDLGDLVLTSMVIGSDGSGAGSYFGWPVQSDMQTVGKFYPGYFTTIIADTGMPCTVGMGCVNGKLATGEALAGALYSGQSFQVDVHAYTLTGDEVTVNLPALRLDPFTRPGAPGTLMLVGAPGRPLSSLAPTTIAAGGALTLRPLVSLPNAYDSATPQANNWAAPTTMFVRASADITRVTASGTKPDPVTSNRGAASVEGGVQIVSGRLQVNNAFGSDSLRLPVRINAQFWSGSAWSNNAGDTATSIGPAAAFTSCLRNLSTGAAPPNNCKPVVALDTTTSVTLGDTGGGVATVWLKAPGAGNSGSAMMKMTGAPSWLPSTVGQAVFGIYKSPLIYIREVY
jgi:uncharacterized repeat protein (TIGR01451 family)